MSAKTQAKPELVNQDAGGYDVKVIQVASKPKWSEMSVATMMDLAFKNRLIKDAGHSIIKAQVGG